MILFIKSDIVAREVKTYAFQAIGLLAGRMPQLFRYTFYVDVILPALSQLVVFLDAFHSLNSSCEIKLLKKLKLQPGNFRGI